jgi:transcriptional regulator with XRE-family HTH domain
MAAKKSDPEATIGGRIAQARFQLSAERGKVTQAWLAKQVGVSGPTVSQWESGVTEPSLASMAKIAKALKVSPSWLAWGLRDAPTASFAPIVEPTSKKKGG